MSETTQHSAPEGFRPTRRHVVLGGLGAGGLVIAAGTGPAAAAPPTPGRWTAGRSANGWAIDGRLAILPVEGTGLTVRLRPGPTSVVLLHVARRFHYELDSLRAGDLHGATTDRDVRTPEQSNLLSGTALAIRPGSYPVGARGSLYPAELVVVRDIVAECDGVLAWGGDLETAQEGHFEIAVPPGDPALGALATRLGSLDERPGRGAGATDAFAAHRRRRAAAYHARRARR